MGSGLVSDSPKRKRSRAISSLGCAELKRVLYKGFGPCQLPTKTAISYKLYENRLSAWARKHEIPHRTTRRHRNSPLIIPLTSEIPPNPLLHHRNYENGKFPSPIPHPFEIVRSHTVSFSREARWTYFVSIFEGVLGGGGNFGGYAKGGKEFRR